MPILRTLSLLLVGAIAAAGQGFNPAAPESSVKPSDLCTVEGVVVKSTTGEGIKGATVQLSPVGAGEQPYTANTDKGGYFIFHGILPGRYVMSAEGGGYTQPPSGGGRGNGSFLDLAPGKNVKGISFRMVPPGVITGTVYDQDGDPVTGAQVQAMRVADLGSHRQVGGMGSGQTNDLGEFRIWGLAPGKYLIDVTYQPRQANSSQPTDEVYLPTYHPGTPDASQATVVEVRAGAESSGIDVDLTQAHAVMVRGRVTAEGRAKSLRGIYVSLTPRAAPEGSYSVANYGGSVQDDSGDFEIRNVPPGPYTLAAFWSDGNRQLYGKAAIEVGNANLDGVNFVLDTAITLTGRFHVEGESQLDFTRLGLWLLSADKTMASANSEVNPDGAFVVPNVYDGIYRLHVTGFPEQYYVKSAQEGGSDVLESGLSVSHSQPLARLEIVLSPDGGRVEGTVLHEQRPVGGALVVLAPDAPHRDRAELFSTKSTDGLGRFSLLGLPPGGFKLFAWEPVQGTDYTDPDVIGTFEDRGTPIHIEANQQQDVQLELITAEEQLR